MRTFIVLSAFLAVAFARPNYFLNPHIAAPIAYAKVGPGAPTGFDGRVVDTPEVSLAKAEHAAAHINERITFAQVAVRSKPYHVIAYFDSRLPAGSYPVGAPTGPDGRVVDTPEVSLAKAEHAAAYINEKITHAQAAARSPSYDVPLYLHTLHP